MSPISLIGAAARTSGRFRCERRSRRRRRSGCNSARSGPGGCRWRTNAILAADARRERRHLARFRRSGFSRSAGHGIQPPARRQQEAEKADAWTVDGDIRIALRNDPPLARRQRSARLAEIHPRRILRRLPRAENREDARRPNRASASMASFSSRQCSISRAFTEGLGNPFPYLTRLPSYAAVGSRGQGPGVARRSRRRRSLRQGRISFRLARRSARRRRGRAQGRAGRRADGPAAGVVRRYARRSRRGGLFARARAAGRAQARLLRRHARRRRDGPGLAGRARSGAARVSSRR